MPTRRLPDNIQWQKPLCRHPEHNPPSHFAPPPGLYEHECPACGNKIVFRVDGVICENPRPDLNYKSLSI